MERFGFLGANRNFSASIGSFQGLPAELSEVILLSQRLALKYNTTHRCACQHFLTSFFYFLCGGAELPQSKPTALPVPSEREPLARPQTLHFSRKLCRYAKGPILEGAVCDQREQTGGVQARTPSVIACGDATFPKGTAFGGGGRVSGIAQRRPLGGAGCEHSEQTEGVRCQKLPLRGSWRGSA